MKKVTTVLAMLILVLALSLGAFAFQNEPDAFRGLKWGDLPGEDMIFVVGDNVSNIYTRPQDKMSLGEAKLDKIIYTFVQIDKGLQFVSAVLWFFGKENFEILEIICKAKFGPPTGEKLFELYWISRETIVGLSYDFIEAKGTLGLSDNELLTVYSNLEKKEKVESAKSDW